VFVQTEKGDRVVFQYNVPTVDCAGNQLYDGIGSNLQIINPVEDDDRYIVLWKRSSDGQYQLMWKGDFKSCLKEFTEICTDLENSYLFPNNELKRNPGPPE